MDRYGLTALVLRIADAAAVMTRKFDVVATNPPYLGKGNMGYCLELPEPGLFTEQV